MSGIEWLVSFFCLQLLLVTIVTNLRSVYELSIANSIPVLILSRLGLVPTWHFFSPKPSIYSFHILYRECYGNSAHAPWRLVSMPLARNKYLSFIYNPTSRLHKTLIDMSLELARSKEVGESMVFGNAYLHVLQYVTKQPTTLFATSVQFCVALETFDHGRSVIFLSKQHAIV